MAEWGGNKSWAGKDVTGTSDKETKQQKLNRLSYYEYEADRRLTDKEWKDELDKPNPPKQPEWLQPLLPTQK
jgi:hypothetical protein